MKCLDCNKEMATYKVHTLLHSLTYDVCESCGGLWLDHGELDKMAFQIGSSIEFCTREVDEDDPDSKRKCPRCPNLHLFHVMFMGTDKIVLDRCENCAGCWLSGGQLEQIDKELARIMPVSGKGFSEFITETHLPHYARRTRINDEKVDTQPVLPVKHAKPLGKTDHPCPLCETPLDAYKVYGITIESCSKCNGLWLTKGEVKTLRDKAAAQSDSELRWMNDEIAVIEKTSAVKSNRHCPACHSELLMTTRFGSSDVMLDWCGKCHGTWLDHDEFEEIVQYEKDALHSMTSEEMKKKAAEEIKRIWSDSSESKITEILDAKAAISALGNITLFEHPKLLKLVLGASSMVRTAGG